MQFKELSETIENLLDSTDADYLKQLCREFNNAKIGAETQDKPVTQFTRDIDAQYFVQAYQSIDRLSYFAKLLMDVAKQVLQQNHTDDKLELAADELDLQIVYRLQTRTTIKRDSLITQGVPIAQIDASTSISEFPVCYLKRKARAKQLSNTTSGESSAPAHTHIHTQTSDRKESADGSTKKSNRRKPAVKRKAKE